MKAGLPFITIIITESSMPSPKRYFIADEEVKMFTSVFPWRNSP
jgi:hypothetical protein